MNNSIENFMFTLIESILLYWLINSIMSSRFSGKKKLLAVFHNKLPAAVKTENCKTNEITVVI